MLIAVRSSGIALEGAELRNTPYGLSRTVASSVTTASAFRVRG